MASSKSSSHTNILIIGAGPAGMMAAIAASRSGASVTVIDQMPQLGMKLLVTGGGRCNITNNLDMAAFLARFGDKKRFVQSALHAFNRDHLLSFFQDIGVPTHSADGFHVFPRSESAKDVRDALAHIAGSQGVRFLAGMKAADWWMENGLLRGLRLESESISADSIILASGGRSYSQLGSTGSGYHLARDAGHTVIEPLPALVPLVSQETWPSRCTGIAISPAAVWIDLPEAKKRRYAGDLLFTHRGISGPAALDISGDVAALLRERENVPLRISFVPDMPTEEQWRDLLVDWQSSGGVKVVRNFLKRYMPDAVAREICGLTKCPESLQAAQLTRNQRQSLAFHLAGIPITITETEGFGKAMVTRGGVCLKEVNPKTLGSRLLPNLFFAGEVLDVDGPCGGYNLQWAFSSGYLAGLSAAKRIPASDER